MAWKFESFRDRDPDKVIDLVEDALNRIAKEYGNVDAVSTKIALSNRKSGKSFGVVFFDTEGKSQKTPTEPIKFESKTFSVKEDDPDPVFREVRDLLGTITDQKAFWAQVGLTDRQSGDTVITLYWPD